MASRSFFFSSRRRHTRLVGDWSSDVCSSDLQRHGLRRLSRQVPAPPAAACIPCRRWTPRPPCQDRSALRPVHARALGAVLPARLFARSQSRRVGLGANQDPWAQQAPATPQRVAPRQGRVGPRCHSFSPGTRSVFLPCSDCSLYYELVSKLSSRCSYSGILFRCSYARLALRGQKRLGPRTQLVPRLVAQQQAILLRGALAVAAPGVEPGQ